MRGSNQLVFPQVQRAHQGSSHWSVQGEFCQGRCPWGGTGARYCQVNRWRLKYFSGIRHLTQHCWLIRFEFGWFYKHWCFREISGLKPSCSRPGVATPDPRSQISGSVGWLWASSYSHLSACFHNRHCAAGTRYHPTSSGSECGATARPVQGVGFCGGISGWWQWRRRLKQA